jgi:hypothetical protein
MFEFGSGFGFGSVSAVTVGIEVEAPGDLPGSLLPVLPRMMHVSLVWRIQAPFGRTLGSLGLTPLSVGCLFVFCFFFLFFFM